MKIPIRLMISLAAGNACAQSAALDPLYEETFNIAHDRVELRNGAALGGPGTGVSGKSADRAFIGMPRSSEQEENGPVAVATIAPVPLSAFTCTFWYFLEENGPVLQMPLNTAGVMVLLNERGLELRIGQSPTQPRQLTFSPGPTGPLAGWRDTGRWIFAALSWDRATNTVVVHQGLPDRPVAFMRDMRRDAPAKPTLPRPDLTRNPETIGNTHVRFDRPVTGRLDNVRVYDRVLDAVELERIRQADVANTPPTYK